VRQKRIEVEIPDPLFPSQWHLVSIYLFIYLFLHTLNFFLTAIMKLNTGQFGGNVGYDLNVVPVWEEGINGTGVVVAMVDDGTSFPHPFL